VSVSAPFLALSVLMTLMAQPVARQRRSGRSAGTQWRAGRLAA
jgi:hypothetical protein